MDDDGESAGSPFIRSGLSTPMRLRLAPSDIDSTSTHQLMIFNFRYPNLLLIIYIATATLSGCHCVPVDQHSITSPLSKTQSSENQPEIVGSSPSASEPQPVKSTVSPAFHQQGITSQYEKISDGRRPSDGEQGKPTASTALHQQGIASWYGKAFIGHRTASGERLNMKAMTAAHRTLPLGSYVRVTLASTGKSVIVRINDRGPFNFHRIIDLSYAAASALGIQRTGTARVEITQL
ncbi:septal ring lytic transglycosylase RlpA family protein [Burkholderia sp. YIM B11467]